MRSGWRLALVQPLRASGSKRRARGFTPNSVDDAIEEACRIGLICVGVERLRSAIEVHSR